MQKHLLVLIFCCLQTSLCSAKELQVGVEELDYFPIYAQRENGYAGFARDLLDAFAKEYNHTLVYRAYPIKRLYGEYLRGRLDLKFPANKHWARELKAEKNVLYSSPVLEYIDDIKAGNIDLSEHSELASMLRSIQSKSVKN